MVQFDYKFPTIEELRAQCRTDLTEEDNLLKIYLQAAIKKAQTYTNRIFYENKIPKDAEDCAMLVEPDIKLALLLAVSFWYIQREDTSNNQLYPIPLGFKDLLEPYRYINI